MLPLVGIGLVFTGGATLYESVLLGEKVAIELLEARKKTFPEDFDIRIYQIQWRKNKIAL